MRHLQNDDQDQRTAVERIRWYSWSHCPRWTSWCCRYVALNTAGSRVKVTRAWAAESLWSQDLCELPSTFRCRCNFQCHSAQCSYWKSRYGQICLNLFNKILYIRRSFVMNLIHDYKFIKFSMSLVILNEKFKFLCIPLFFQICLWFQIIFWINPGFIQFYRQIWTT